MPGVNGIYSFSTSQVSYFYTANCTRLYLPVVLLRSKLITFMIHLTDGGLDPELFYREFQNQIDRRKGGDELTVSIGNHPPNMVPPQVLAFLENKGH